MKKYFFEEKLEEGILIQKPGRMLPSVIINGKEEDAVCPWRGIFPKRMEYGMPCLAGRGGTEGFYHIYAISLDHAEDVAKNWICISAELIERAIGFFLENYQMEGFNADYKHVIRNANLRQAHVDYLAGGLMIEIKCSFAGLNAVCRNRKQGRGLMPTAWQMLEFINLLNTPDYWGKRAVFLLVLQQGLDDGHLHPVSSGIMYESLKTALCMGVEFWSMAFGFDKEGISMVSCRNIDELILSGNTEK